MARSHAPLTPRACLLIVALVPALAAGTAAWPARAEFRDVPVCSFSGPQPAFPHIQVCAFPGAYQDSSLIRPKRCVGSFAGARPDSIREQGRTITLRFR